MLRANKTLAFLVLPIKLKLNMRIDLKLTMLIDIKLIPASDSPTTLKLTMLISRFLFPTSTRNIRRATKIIRHLKTMKGMHKSSKFKQHLGKWLSHQHNTFSRKNRLKTFI